MLYWSHKKKKKTPTETPVFAHTGAAPMERGGSEPDFTRYSPSSPPARMLAVTLRRRRRMPGAPSCRTDYPSGKGAAEAAAAPAGLLPTPAPGARRGARMSRCRVCSVSRCLQIGFAPLCFSSSSFKSQHKDDAWAWLSFPSAAAGVAQSAAPSRCCGCPHAPPPDLRPLLRLLRGPCSAPLLPLLRLGGDGGSRSGKGSRRGSSARVSRGLCRTAGSAV
ncbi:hypothetical protein BS78_01G460900 [Paspalum vaginatum]|nr:hypothetical protein BS78_01G460900 [Paspalum vaginatum]